MADWYKKDKNKCLKELKTSVENGLSGNEARIRLSEYGKNQLTAKERKSPLVILFNQIKEVMILILIGAAVISAVMGDELEAIVILIIVILNTILGFWQEFRAEKAIAALKKLSVPDVRLIRDGKPGTIPAFNLVPGDIIHIESGNIIPADARLIESANLKVQESALTGESEPVSKDSDFLPWKDTPLADRKNMIYRGTIVTFGRGEAVVTETGMNTEIGKIASMLEEVEEDKTPLQKRLARLGGILTIAALILIAVVAGLSLLRGEDLKTTVLTAISMAVAAIPEGLPALVTIALALGARKMLKKNALIRNLPSVETLGSVTVICSDKTGTLTQNQMTVTEVVTLDKKVPFSQVAKKKELKVHPDIMILLVGGALCNDAAIEGEKMVGDPTEGALVAAVEKIGKRKGQLERKMPRVSELPFSSERKRMSTVHQMDKALSAFIDKPGSYILFTKGSVDGLMEISSSVLMNGRVHPITNEIKEKVLQANHDMSAKGIRVLGVACKTMDKDSLSRKDKYEQNLIFTGMAGMMDPVRLEIADAVHTCKTAGIRPIMITGDHPLTALNIAKNTGITDKDEFLTGKELSVMTDKELKEAASRISVYARVSPEHKMKLVDALQSNGHIVSMTGDGVNDAPALKSADIGVAMGITGTDVSKQSSDMVLLDDNFATIVEAVKQGRRIFDNIKKFIKYILTGNVGEILVMLLGPLLGMPIPLFPIQILWINLVTDGAPGIAMGYEPPEKNVMKRPPYKPSEGIFAHGVGRQILWVGFLVAFLSIGVGLIDLIQNPGSGEWQTMIFTTLTFCQMQYAFCVRSYRQSVFTQNPFSNLILFFTVTATFGIQLVIIYAPLFQGIFYTKPLSPEQLGLCFLGSFGIVLGVEIEKLIRRAFIPIALLRG